MTPFENKLLLMLYNDLHLLSGCIRERRLTFDEFEDELMTIKEMDELLLNLMKHKNDEARINN